MCLSLLGLLLWAGCGDDDIALDGGGVDAGPDVPSIDAPPAMDAPFDASMDAPSDAGWDAPIEAGTDAGDAGPDGASCDCPSDTECLSYECSPEGACIERLTAFGRSCGELTGEGYAGGICADGACITRGCGDGFVEPGPRPVAEPPPSAPAEVCDDGNDDESDGCSSLCEATPLELRADPIDFEDPENIPSEVDIRVERRSVGVDDAGRVLFVWSETPTETNPRRVLAQRHDAAGVAIDAEPFEVTRSASFAEDVLGMPDGWIVTYNSPSGVVQRRILSDGTVRPAGRLSTEAESSQERDARMARIVVSVGGELRPGFVAVWQNGPDLQARRFTVAGASVSAADADAFMVDMPRRSSGIPGPVREWFVSGNGTQWLVTYQKNDDPGTINYFSVHGRRYDGATPIDSAAFSLALPEAGDVRNIGHRATSVGLAHAGESDALPGEFFVAWYGGTATTTAGGTVVDQGDLFVRHLSAGPSSAFPAPVTLAVDADGLTNRTPLLARIPAEYAPDELASGDNPWASTGQVLVVWETGADVRPRLRVSFAVVDVAGGDAGAVPVPSATVSFTSRLMEYEGGLSAVTTSPARGTRGVWLTALTQALLTEPDALNAMVAFLLPIDAPSLPEAMSLRDTASLPFADRWSRVTAGARWPQAMAPSQSRSVPGLGSSR